MAKKQSKKTKNRFIKLQNLYYNVSVTCDYEDMYSYDEAPDYHAGDSYIRNAEVESVDRYMAEYFFLKDDTVAEKYCIDRILHYSGFYNPDNYDVHVEMGYYGEEIEKVVLLNDNIIITPIEEMLKLKDCTEKIKYVLTGEYGYLLGSLKELTFKLKTIKYSDIHIPNDDYCRRIDQDIVKKYAEHALPIGIVRFDGEKHILVDGYHRFAAMKNKEEVEVFVGS